LSATPPDPLATAEAALRAGRAVEALTGARDRLRVQPHDTRALSVLARAAHALGRPDEARAAIEKAVAEAPGQPEARILLVQLLLAIGDATGAREVAEALRTQLPDVEQVLVLAVEACIRAGDASAAARLAEDFATRHAASRPALLAWLRALQAARATPAACLAVNRRIAALDGSAVDWVLYAMGLTEGGYPREAAAAMDQALRLDPGFIPARWMKTLTPEPLVHPDTEAEERFRIGSETGVRALDAVELAALSAAQAELALIAAPRFNRHYLGGAMADWQRRSGAVLEALAARALPRPVPRRPKATCAKPRVGICSAFLRRHTVTRLFGGLIDAIDPAEFDLGLFAPTDQIDEVTKRLGARAQLVESGEHTLAEWSATLDRFAPDVLVFLDVGMSSQVEGLAARRHAPIQAMLWGHPVTSGLSTMDWFLTSDAMERAGGEADYSERVWRLPGLGTTFARPDLDTEPVAELEALPASTLVCAVPQMAQKLRPVHDQILVDLARAAPELVFAFTPHAVASIGAQFRSRIARRFNAAGLDADTRIVLCRSLPHPGFLGLAARADFALDTIDWSGGNTSLEMFAFDLPILTLPRDTLRSRHTAAMLERLELPELIATNEADYLERAIRLARDSAWRGTLRQRIRERKSRLYGDHRVAESFVEFLRHACAGHLPGPLPT
jgi:predicted O-linked N-acetylglucosamine transferase (SPINDLY family)